MYCDLPRSSQQLHVPCRAYRQEQQRGLTCYELEFWVERAIVQICKRETKFRTTKNPELVLVHSILLALALMRNLHQYPDELEKEEKRCKGKDLDNDAIDISCPDNMQPGINGEFFIGPGKKPRVRDMPQLKSVVSKYLQAFPTLGWTGYGEHVILTYKRLALKGSELVNSTSYTLEHRRQSHWCTVRFQEVRSGGYVEITYVARVKQYLLVKNNAAGVLRIAECQLWEASANEDYTGQFLEVQPGAPKHESYPVNAAQLDSKVLFANLTIPELQSHRNNEWRFISYPNVQSDTQEEAT